MLSNYFILLHVLIGAFSQPLPFTHKTFGCFKSIGQLKCHLKVPFGDSPYEQGNRFAIVNGDCNDAGVIVKLFNERLFSPKEPQFEVLFNLESSAQSISLCFCSLKSCDQGPSATSYTTSVGKVDFGIKDPKTTDCDEPCMYQEEIFSTDCDLLSGDTDNGWYVYKDPSICYCRYRSSLDCPIHTSPWGLPFQTYHQDCIVKQECVFANYSGGSSLQRIFLIYIPTTGEPTCSVSNPYPYSSPYTGKGFSLTPWMYLQGYYAICFCQSMPDDAILCSENPDSLKIYAGTVTISEYPIVKITCVGQYSKCSYQGTGGSDANKIRLVKGGNCFANSIAAIDDVAEVFDPAKGAFALTKWIHLVGGFSICLCHGVPNTCPDLSIHPYLTKVGSVNLTPFEPKDGGCVVDEPGDCVFVSEGATESDRVTVKIGDSCLDGKLLVAGTTAGYEADDGGFHLTAWKGIIGKYAVCLCRGNSCAAAGDTEYSARIGTVSTSPFSAVTETCIVNDPCKVSKKYTNGEGDYIVALRGLDCGASTTIGDRIGYENDGFPLSKFRDFGVFNLCLCHVESPTSTFCKDADPSAFRTRIGSVSLIPYRGMVKLCVAEEDCIFGHAYLNADRIHHWAVVVRDDDCGGAAEIVGDRMSYLAGGFNTKSITHVGKYSVCFCAEYSTPSVCESAPVKSFSNKIGTLFTGPPMNKGSGGSCRQGDNVCKFLMQNSFEGRNKADRAMITLEKCGEQKDSKLVIYSMDDNTADLSDDLHEFIFVINTTHPVNANYNVCMCTAAAGHSCVAPVLTLEALKTFAFRIGVMVISPKKGYFPSSNYKPASEAARNLNPVMVIITLLFCYSV